MDLSGRTIWQHAAGDTDRSYAETCITMDVILSGPGSSGRWPDCEPALERLNWTTKKIADLRRFAEEMKEGDIVVLRIGTSAVCAVGELVGVYGWHEEFGDVDGWDLQHVRRVRWWHGLELRNDFPTYAMKLGDTTQRLNEGPVMDWLRTLEVPEGAQARPLVDLSVLGEQDGRGNATNSEEISEFLFDRGVASSAISALLREIGELTRIANWYAERSSVMPSEHETVAYLVIPLMRALGWTPQRMAVEWNRIDVALFSSLPRSDETLQVVVEAKKLGYSCLSARSQAERYAESHGNCTRLIVTDGLRYGVYSRPPNAAAGFGTIRSYLNLTRLRRNYPALQAAGAQDALWAMSPEWRDVIVSNGSSS
jgi:hypothetical protein